MNSAHNYLYIIVILLIVLCLIPAIVYARKRFDSGKVSVFLGVGVPMEAPVSVLFAIVKEMKSSDFPTQMCSAGWFRGTISDMEHNNFSSQYPQGFYGVWAALTERKVYELDANFPEEMKEQVKREIENGFINRNGEKTTYTHFKAAILPGGLVKFYLMSTSKTHCLDYPFQAAITSKYDNEFLYRIWDNPSEHKIEEYHDVYYAGKDNITPNAYYVNTVALPNRIWEKYYERYDYGIRFEFENPDCHLDFWAPKFSNAEHFGCQSGVNDDVIIKNPAILCSMNLWWKDSQYLYTSLIYFNENEMLSLFEKAFNSHPAQHGELCVIVGEENKTMELSLNIGKEKYPLKEVEIRVFRDLLSNPHGESELVYKNYKNDHRNWFKGL